MPEAGLPSLVGSYVVLQIDAKAMVAGYVDSPILAVARALGTGRYAALVEREVQFPTCSDALEWRVYRVSFIGRHMHTYAGSSSCAHNCVPIFPTTSSSKADIPIRPSKPFPFPDCCHRPSMETFIRVHYQPYHHTPMCTLSEDQVMKLVMSRKLSSSSPTTATGAHLPSIRSGSDATSLTFWSPAASPRAEAEDNFTRYDHDRNLTRAASPTLSALADLALAPVPSPTSQNFLSTSGSTRPAGLMTPASDSTSRTETYASALFERVRPRRYETMDSMSVYSTSTARSSVVEVNVESPTMSKLVLGSEVDPDEIPLVDISFDLGELDSIPDPRGFVEERDVAIQLVQKAKERRRNDASSRMLTPEPVVDSGSEHYRLLSVRRVRSPQSTNTVPSTANSTSRSRNKPRRVRSQSPSRARSRSRSRQSARHVPMYGSEVDFPVGSPRKLVKRKSIGGSLKQAGMETKTLSVHSARGIRLKLRSLNPCRKIGRFLCTVTARVVVRLGLCKTRRAKRTKQSARGRSSSRDSARVPMV